MTRCEARTDTWPGCWPIHCRSEAADVKVEGTMNSIQPELWVEGASAAVAFYQAAFDAVVVHRVGQGDDIVAQLVVGIRRVLGDRGQCGHAALQPPSDRRHHE